MAIKASRTDPHADGKLSTIDVVGAITASTTITAGTGLTVTSGGATISAGQVALPAGTEALPSFIPSGDINTGTWYPAADTIAWSTGGSERVRVTSAGRIGIGTTSPSVSLDVNGSIITKPGWVTSEGVTDLNLGTVSGSVGTGGFISLRNASGAYNAGGMELYAGGAERIRLAPDRLNIYLRGVVTPTDGNLQTGVFNDTTLAPVSSTNYVGAYWAENFYSPPSGVTITNACSYYASAYKSGAGSLTNWYGIYVNSSTPATNNYAAFFGGKVGIGTSSPSYALHVKGRAYVENTSDVISTIASTSTGKADMEIFASSSANARIILGRGASTKWFLLNDYTTDRFTVTDAEANDGVQLAQNATSWTTYSDSRLKDVQGTITDALAKVGQLTGVKFTWKRDQGNPDAKVRVGLIAQDVQAVLPEAVDDESPDLITDEETGKVSGGLGVRYTEVVPLLVNAIKELTARVITLEQAAA